MNPFRQTPLYMGIGLIFLSLVCVSCTEDAPDKILNKVYCVHNGYSSWSPCCKEMQITFSMITLIDCETEGGFQKIDRIYTPTNVTEEYK